MVLNAQHVSGRFAGHSAFSRSRESSLPQFHKDQDAGSDRQTPFILSLCWDLGGGLPPLSRAQASPSVPPLQLQGSPLCLRMRLLSQATERAGVCPHTALGEGPSQSQAQMGFWTSSPGHCRDLSRQLSWSRHSAVISRQIL